MTEHKQLMTGATQRDALKLCKQLELITPQFGFHVALTGGCLYGEGYRKDIDIVLYRIRQRLEDFDLEGLERAFKMFGYTVNIKSDWLWKLIIMCDDFGQRRSLAVDILFPDAGPGDYPEEEEGS